MEGLMEDEIELFLNKIGDEVDIDMSCIDIEQIDITDAFSSIKVQLLDNNAFEQEVIYYSNAMEYLTENDNSLRESLEIADDLGFRPNNLNSEVLASLLKTRKCEEEFESYEDKINEFFENLNNKIKEIEKYETK
jgi:uncharacterized protein (DUF1786 family)